MIERYTRPQMGALFTDQHKYDTWLAVELAVCEAWARQGDIPKAAFERIRQKARFKIKRIEEIEEQVQHDVIAFTTAVSEFIGEDSAFFHRGLTSSDVVDTAQSLVLKQAGQLLEEGLLKLKQALAARAIEHKHTPVMGRTHGVHAEPTTFGLKLLVWYDELSRHEERLASAIDNIAVGKLSGAVGNFAHIPPAFEEQVLKKLGLRPAPVSNQIVQRDRHAQFVTCLALIGATLEKIAVNLRTYQRTEIGEVQEPFSAGQKGSSAMPHKKNPILLERITGLARVLRGYAVTALENVALWDERDISHSGAERVILPDSCIALDYMMAKLAGVIEKLEIRADRMERNIYLTKGLIFSQRVLLALTAAGMSRETAYAVVQKNAMRCWQDGTPLQDVLLSDREVRGVLAPVQINALFTLEPYLAHIDAIFERVGLSVPAAKARPEPKQEPKRGRGRRAKIVTQPAITEGGAVQNITERPSDWYETAALATNKGARPALDTPDDFLGEADHEREARLVRGRRRIAEAKSRRRAPARSGDEPAVPAATPPAKPAARPAAKTAAKPAAKPEAPAEAPAKAAPARGRRTRAAAKPAAETKSDAKPGTAPAEPRPAAEPPAPASDVSTDAAAFPKRRRRGSRGGRRHKRSTNNGAPESGEPEAGS